MPRHSTVPRLAPRGGGTRDECRHASSTRPISPPVHQTKPPVRKKSTLKQGRGTNADSEGGSETNTDSEGGRDISSRATFSSCSSAGSDLRKSCIPKDHRFSESPCSPTAEERDHCDQVVSRKSYRKSRESQLC